MNNSILKKVGASLLASMMLVSVMTGCNKDKPVDGETSGIDASHSDVPLPTTKVKSSKVSYDEMVKLMEADQKINENVTAYLNVPGTNIQMPVLHNANEDNEYYIDRKLDGSIAGANYNNIVDTVVYAEQRTNFAEDVLNGSANYVLFGHNWNNIRPPYAIGDDGTDKYTMFAELPSFTDKEFAESNPYIYLSTADNEMIFKVFAVFYSEADWVDKESGVTFNYIDPNLSNSQKSTFYGQAVTRSMWNYSEVECAPSDIFVTLSTCTREFEAVGGEQRFIVVGRMLREGEDDTADTTKIFENVDYVEPNF